MAYVVVVHLAPNQPSAMAELLGRVAQIPVSEAQDGKPLAPDHAFVIPPGKEAHVYDGRIELLERSDTHPTLAIDPFLRSLAADQGENAGAVILSGTGSDGSGGIKDIKTREGLVLVQTAATADHGGMPRSAMFTGVADMELAPGDMPQVLVQHFRYGPAPPIPEDLVTVDEDNERWLTKVFTVVRSQVGHDFAPYKRSTLLRRIRRRMSLHQIKKYDDYIRLLRESTSEVETLFREFLIGVTHFFRDAEAFETLRDKSLVPMLEKLPTDTSIRAWVPGCSTGEEAYSLGMILHEAFDRVSEKRFSTMASGRRHGYLRQ
jgi:two-component system CheB/CheR fusion protein